MLTNGSLQGVTILKDKSLEDNTGVAFHPDLIKELSALLAASVVLYTDSIYV